MPRLSAKTALVAGAASDIGAAIAKAFPAEDAHVIVADVDIDVEGGKEVADATGGTFVRLDVTNETDWTAIADQFPALDVLVNNAGITGLEGVPVAQDPENATLAAWRAVHAVNLDGPSLGCRFAIWAMRAKEIRVIISISSRSGLVGIPTAAAYASSKAAIRNHINSVVLYCAGQGLNIRRNSIHPDAVMTPLREPMLGSGPDRAAREVAIVADPGAKVW